MKTVQFTLIPKKAYDKQQAKYQLVTKISWFLLAVIAVLAMVLYSQVHQKTDLQDQRDQLFGVVAAKNREIESLKEEPTPSPAAEEEVKPDYLGEYTITYYCPCEKCCGEWSDGVTSTGVYAQEGVTIAVDPEQIPYGTELYIEGVGYRTAQDCGGAIKGNRIDVYMDSHQEAIQGGRHEADIYIVN